MVVVLPTGSFRTVMGFLVWMVRQPVVVDDLQNLRLVQARYGLGLLVVVHQDHLLAAGPQQMVAGQGAHHPLLLIQKG